MNQSIFKAYDIRGIYPDELNEKDAYEIGRAFAIFSKNKQVIIGYDMRLSSVKLFKSLSKGITTQGVDVINIGQVSTDAFYFASGHLNLPGIMITASHNPSYYNGFKICLAAANVIRPVQLLPLLTKSKSIPSKKGKIIKKDILRHFKKHVLKFINTKKIRPLKIVIDAGNGMAGKIVPFIFRGLPCQIKPLYFELDGSFPNHIPNPSKAANTKDLQKMVLREKADLGIAFDGDADRAFFIDEQGKRVNSSLIIALISKKILSKKPNQTIIYSLICSRIVKEIIEKYKGKAVMERVGHVFIKDKMRKTKAIFGGESSGHYYFRDNYFADSGIIASLIILEALSEENKPFSDIVKEYKKYYSIEETDIKLNDKQKAKIVKLIEKKYKDGKISYIDGITVEYKDWWFNLRPSNTEPLIRFNLEAVSRELMEEKKREILGQIKQVTSSK